MEDILSDIIANKRVEIEALKETTSIDYLYRNSVEHKTISLREALERSDTGIISEFKRRSPSKGWIHRNAAPLEVAEGYAKGGASAMSILTDEKYFGGSLNDIAAVRTAVKIPILRKDFTIDRFQLHQARAIGADAVLLIAAALNEIECKKLAHEAHALGLETLLEVHSEKELAYISDDIDVVGVNNRHLGTFETSVEASVALAAKLPQTLTRISESGLKDAQTIFSLRELGYKGFLVGELLMRNDKPAEALKNLIDKLKELNSKHE